MRCIHATLCSAQQFLPTPRLPAEVYSDLRNPSMQDLETKESDLWGSRGVALAGLIMLFMALQNFRGTLVRLTSCFVQGIRRFGSASVCCSLAQGGVCALQCCSRWRPNCNTHDSQRACDNGPEPLTMDFCQADCSLQ